MRHGDPAAVTDWQPPQLGLQTPRFDGRTELRTPHGSSEIEIDDLEFGDCLEGTPRKALPPLCPSAAQWVLTAVS